MMDNENMNDILDLLDTLYDMVVEARGVPLGNEKCIIERDKAVEIINEVKALLPMSVAEAKRLVSARDEFIGNAKREAEAVRKNAEEKARAMIEEQEIVRISRQKSADMISAAETKSRELRRLASEYVQKMMQQCEDTLNQTLSAVHSTRSAFDSMDKPAQPQQTAGDNQSVRPAMQGGAVRPDVPIQPGRPAQPGRPVQQGRPAQQGMNPMPGRPVQQNVNPRQPAQEPDGRHPRPAQHGQRPARPPMDQMAIEEQSDEPQVDFLPAEFDEE